MIKNPIFEAVEKKFDVAEVVAVLFCDSSGHFAECKSLEISQDALLCFDDFDSVTVEKIKQAEKDESEEYWVF